ncbi:bifunctional 2-C-methyl-D-erythritol 4-phosphate cytidylyltransferase/2-C-methyl-D-erythritol 2,4-cyclodiphosphate synthase [Roseovarius nitratireducens]|uniref:bifunctional 2-C-methyl-D-erythritol 4-phosphate cytidylyltransferase/2-C-methyl-D-erythritol 2,4-cyclodiphosphate synthase n=1 Tax=Roseovarius nitratireducens TaxID=2044597 RepID=UPI000CE1764B|nr:bifunctional 2-C-methyl-D-erythritol 4-phosphate cytidylyltransferase/2-C-methyl-D-erythritol 2,4-cyclodiphosphate synthase [Roseovarius nitratireducens]
MTRAALIVAAGRGTRAGGDLPKQWQPLAGRRVLDWTLAALTPHVARVVLVLHPDDMERAPAGVEAAPGGATRAASVRAGLENLAAHGIMPHHVLIHDAARATPPRGVIEGVIAALDAGAPAAAPALPVTDALWTGAEGYVTGTQDRTGLYAAQTPQGFDFAAILAAHRAHDGTAADDVAVARAAGLPVTITPGDADNLKITHAEDFPRADRILGAAMDIRVGTGFDVHRFGPGDHVMLCGVAVPHARGLQGHSDADVGLHALTDAIYGALAEGDIGRHFPPSDPQWKGTESHVFLRHAARLVADKGFRINNMDVTLICEHPKIGPHAQVMRAAIAGMTGVAPDRVSVKATTTERLGFTGRGEGIAAQAAVTLMKDPA